MAYFIAWGLQASGISEVFDTRAMLGVWEPHIGGYSEAPVAGLVWVRG